MAHTKVTKTGTQNTGTANTFSYSGSFDVFKASEVEVELDNVALTFTTSTINESASPREYTVDYGNKTVHIGGANLTGTNSVVIQPVTDMGSPTPRATYTPGASVTSDDLNNNQLQLMRKAMEYDEQKLSSRGGTMTGNLHFAKDIDITFEGDTDNAHEITLTVADPTSDKTITLPDTTGTVITTGDSQTITTSMIASNAINSDRLANDAVNSQHYVDGSIDHVHLANNLIDGDNIQDDVINSEHYVAGSIDHEHLANDIIDGDNIQDGVINSEHYANGSIDHVHLANDIIDGDNIQDNAIDSEHYVDGSINESHLNTNSVTRTKILNDAINGDKIADDSIDNEHIAANAVRVDQIKNAEITVAKLNPSAVINNSEQASATTNDTSFLTSAASDGRYFRQDSTETIASGDTWSAGDSRIATTGAIDLRIIDLVDDVGGFVPIVDEETFPDSNPDINTSGSAKGGTIVSIKAITTQRTPSGGTVTIANGNISNGQTITITGCGSTVLPVGYGVLVETTATDHTYAFHRLTPKATEVSTVAANATAVSTAATNVVDINNFADVYQISSSAPTQRADSSSLSVGDLWFDSSSNKVMMVYDGSSGDGFSAVTPNQSDLVNIGIVSGQLIFQEDLGLITNAVSTGTGNQTLNTVAGIASNVTTVAGIASNVTTVANNNTNVSTVAGKATEIGRLGTSDAVADMNTLGTTAIVSDMDTLADISSNITTVAGVSGNVTTVAGIASNVTTVAGISSNVTAVANDATDIGAVAGKATEIGRLGTADAVADLAILGTTDVVADMNTLATSANVTAMDNCSDDIANINTVSGSIGSVNTTATNIANVNTTATNIANVNTTANNISSVNTVAGNNTNVSTVATNISNVNTAASNISNVNNFTEKYQIASSAPSTDGGGNSLAAGDLYFDTSTNELRVYNGSSWQGGVTASGNLAGLGTNTFTGLQTLQAGAAVTGNITVSGTVDGIDIATRDTLFGGLTSSSGVLSNGVTATTQGTSDNSTKVATTAYVTTAVGNVTTDLVGDTSPQLGGTLDGQNNNMSNIGTIDGSNLQLDFGTL